jgi:hypothetical protein
MLNPLSKDANNCISMFVIIPQSLEIIYRQVADRLKEASKLIKRGCIHQHLIFFVT